MRIELYPVGERDDDSYWVLDLADDRIRLYDDEDELVGKWSDSEGAGSFQMPSFWASRKKFGITLDRRTIDFTVRLKDLRAIQAFLDRQHVREHPDAPTRSLTIGGLMVVGGLAMVAVAAAVWYLTYERAAAKPEGGRFFIWSGGILVGISIACRGLYKVGEYTKWKRLLEEDDRGG